MPRWPEEEEGMETSKRADSVGINRHGVVNERVTKKGIANHLESESCEGVRKDALEALTGAYAGGGIELRNRKTGSRRSCPGRKARRRGAFRGDGLFTSGV